ncbi:MAG: hypothetical protein R2853_06065 [Thermomicrobiales bacterium]
MQDGATRLLATPRAPVPMRRHLAQDGEFSDVIGVVVDDDEHLAQQGVPGVARHGHEEVIAFILNHGGQRLTVCQKARHGSIPLGLSNLDVLGGPVVARPLWLGVDWVSDITQDICLGQPQVLDQAPEAVVNVRRARVDVRLGELGHCVLETQVRVARAQVPGELLANSVVRVHRLIAFRVGRYNRVLPAAGNTPTRDAVPARLKRWHGRCVTAVRHGPGGCAPATWQRAQLDGRGDHRGCQSRSRYRQVAVNPARGGEGGGSTSRIAASPASRVMRFFAAPTLARSPRTVKPWKGAE